MAETTGIAWTDSTFNPWMGCTKVSPACQFCYAERDTKRWGRVKWGPSGARIRTSEDYWKEPLRWNREAEATGLRHKVFCASLADVFEDKPEVEPWRADLWKLIEKTPALDWLLLTKRPAQVRRLTPGAWWRPEGFPANVWVGTTVEDQKRAEERIPELLAIPARVRFLSCEPLLERVDVREWLPTRFMRPEPTDDRVDLRRPAPSVSWVIVGGESGPKARPMHPEWARSLRDQCLKARVPFFFKQGSGHGMPGGRPDKSGIFEGEKWPRELPHA